MSFIIIKRADTGKDVVLNTAGINFVDKDQKRIYMRIVGNDSEPKKVEVSVNVVVTDCGREIETEDSNFLAGLE